MQHLQLTNDSTFYFYLQIINLSSHAMPPMRLLSKDFIGSMLSTQKQTNARDESYDNIPETMDLSDDDENSPQNKKIAGRKAIESESSAMWHTMKKREFVNIENKMKSLREEMLNQFEL